MVQQNNQQQKTKIKKPNFELDKNQKEDIKKAFELFDSDGKGTIDRS